MKHVLNINDYDLSKIQKDLDKIVFNISNLATIRAIAQEAQQKKHAIGLVAPMGCGVKTAFNRLKDEASNTVIVVEQHSKGRAKDMLGSLAMQSHSLFKKLKFDWGSCSPANLLECIKFLCDECFKDSLFLIPDCSHYTSSDFQLLHDLIKCTSKKAGIVFSLNPQRAVKLENEATQLEDLQKFLYQVADWPRLNPPSPEEMAVIAHGAGIENPAILDEIVLSSGNLHELRYRINLLRKAVLRLTDKKKDELSDNI